MSGSSASIYQFQCYDYYIITLVNGSMSVIYVVLCLVCCYVLLYKQYITLLLQLARSVLAYSIIYYYSIRYIYMLLLLSLYLLSIIYLFMYWFCSYTSLAQYIEYIRIILCYLIHLHIKLKNNSIQSNHYLFIDISI